MASITEERSALKPLGNGKLQRLAQIVLGGVVSFLVSVLVAQWTAAAASERTRRDAVQASEKAIAVIEERQRNQYQEVIRQLEQLREDLRLERRRDRE